MKKATQSVDDVAEFNEQFIEHTEHRLSDLVYNWIVRRHTRNGIKLSSSDRFVWKGACYLIPTYFGYILFFTLFYFLGNAVYDHYGFPRLFMLFLLLVIWRLNVLIGLQRQANEKLRELVK